MVWKPKNACPKTWSQWAYWLGFLFFYFFGQQQFSVITKWKILTDLPRAQKTKSSKSAFLYIHLHVICGSLPHPQGFCLNRKDIATKSPIVPSICT